MKWAGRKATLLDWICLWSCFAVFCVLLQRGMVRTWSAEGAPHWALAFWKWSNQFIPRWFPF